MAFDIRPFQYEEVTPPPGVDAYVASRGKKPILFFELDAQKYSVRGRRRQTLDEFLEVGEDFFLAQGISTREIVVDIQAVGCRYRDTNLTNLLWGGNETIRVLERVFPPSWQETVSPFQNGQPMYVTLVYGEFKQPSLHNESFLADGAVVVSGNVNNPLTQRTGFQLPYGAAVNDYALLRKFTQERLSEREIHGVQDFLDKKLAKRTRR